MNLKFDDIAMIICPIMKWREECRRKTPRCSLQEIYNVWKKEMSCGLNSG